MVNHKSTRFLIRLTVFAKVIPKQKRGESHQPNIGLLLET
jgi:hypothetical protein